MFQSLFDLKTSFFLIKSIFSNKNKLMTTYISHLVRLVRSEDN